MGTMSFTVLPDKSVYDAQTISGGSGGPFSTTRAKSWELTLPWCANSADRISRYLYPTDSHS
jgi:hypothetical protein